MPALPYWLFPGDDRPTEEIDDEIAEELQLHLDLLAEEQERRGLAPEEAKQKAAERFGDFNQLLRRCRREKQGDVPMLKRVQAVLIALLLIGVIAIGWNQIAMSAAVAANQKDITNALAGVQRQLEKFNLQPVQAASGSDYSPPSYFRDSDGKLVLTDQISSAQPLPILENDSFPLVAAWVPPANPDPKGILDEARADAKAKKYDIALTKHVWFWNNAERLEPSLSGVRLSFALSDWYDLGLDYPPALELLRSIRDNLEVQILRGEVGGERFHDFAAINRVLRDDKKTVAVFTTLDSQYPDAAKRAIHYARRALIKCKAFDLYAKYINAKRDYLVAEHIYDLDLEREKSRDAKFGNGVNKLITASAEKRFREEAATLVALLAIADRKSEAAEIATLAKEKLEDEQFHIEIEAALEGTIPDQDP